MSLSSVSTNLNTAELHNGQERYLPSIDEFLNDTFLLSINELKDQSKIAFIKQFTKYANSLHCLENFQFLILVYHYEFSYSTVFQVDTTKLNPKRNSAIISQSVSSVDNLNQFTSSIDDEAYRNACWEDWRDKNIESDEESENDHDDDEHMQFTVDEDIQSQSDSSSVQTHETNASMNGLKNLNEQWSNIVNNFVLPDSKCQINLSDCSYKLITGTRSQHPDPSVLVPAKNEVLRLLNENVYHRFIINCKNSSVPCSDCECGRADGKRVVSEGVQVPKKETKRSPLLNALKPSRPASPISIDSPLLSPSPSSSINSPNGGIKKKSKGYSLISGSNNSLSSLFNHLKFKTSHTNSNLSSSMSTTANTDEEDNKVVGF